MFDHQPILKPKSWWVFCWSHFLHSQSPRDIGLDPYPLYPTIVHIGLGRRREQLRHQRHLCHQVLWDWCRSYVGHLMSWVTLKKKESPWADGWPSPKPRQFTQVLTEGTSEFGEAQDRLLMGCCWWAAGFFVKVYVVPCGFVSANTGKHSKTFNM